jgi:hypothetical protein
VTKNKDRGVSGRPTRPPTRREPQTQLVALPVSDSDSDSDSDKKKKKKEKGKKGFQGNPTFITLIALSLFIVGHVSEEKIAETGYSLLQSGETPKNFFFIGDVRLYFLTIFYNSSARPFFPPISISLHRTHALIAFLA